MFRCQYLQTARLRSITTIPTSYNVESFVAYPPMTSSSVYARLRVSCCRGIACPPSHKKNCTNKKKLQQEKVVEVKRHSQQKTKNLSLSGGSSHVLVKVIFIPFEESILSSSTVWVWQMSNWASILSLSLSLMGLVTFGYDLVRQAAF